MVLTAADSKALCVTCHEEQAKQIASAKVQHSGAQGDCTTCHNPHAGKSPDFLQPDPVAVCLACHSDQAAEFKRSTCTSRPWNRRAVSATLRTATTTPTCCASRTSTPYAWSATDRIRRSRKNSKTSTS